MPPPFSPQVVAGCIGFFYSVSCVAFAHTTSPDNETSGPYECPRVRWDLKLPPFPPCCLDSWAGCLSSNATLWVAKDEGGVLPTFLVVSPACSLVVSRTLHGSRRTATQVIVHVRFPPRPICEVYELTAFEVWSGCCLAIPIRDIPPRFYRGYVLRGFSPQSF